MADRIEREIEEILERLNEPPPEPKRPVSIKDARKQRRSPTKGPSAGSVEPVELMFLGAALMFIGLIASFVVEPAIWLAFAGVVLILVAYAWSFARGGRPSAPGRSAPDRGGVYWRDRYVQYGPDRTSVLDQIKRRFRR